MCKKRNNGRELKSKIKEVQRKEDIMGKLQCGGDVRFLRKLKVKKKESKENENE